MRKLAFQYPNLISSYLLVVCLPIFSLFAQSNRPEPVFGFYQGGYYLTYLQGETNYTGGSLIQTEKNYQNGLQAQANLGVTPVKMIGTFPFPNGIPLTKDKVQAGDTLKVSMEYGLTDHIGFFISYSVVSIKSQGSNQIALADPKNPNGYTTYIEAVPIGHKIYRDRNYGMGLNYHFLSRNRFDPFVGLELSVLNFESKYRNGQQNNLFYPTDTHPGTGIGGRVTFGTNYFITPEFGLSIEVYGSRKILKSNAFSSESINLAGFQFGFIFNLEAMGKN
ncbi:hypothetical protein [Leptospira bandrabouensis]|uniref:hypothetical protein n=1 Tax=Leptospira bandrabouensis TaxID=2484903 RepID=UPI001EEA372D|nr:hypothetical protein [Leptospira bandrabouensis]MCG6151988.1 hypothetical protein [Leptospira bandrabouensis]MCW7459885.1 hypothetical protein [Leptospira bandrabouensis]MCW7477238.1 hypothetical protein [Leptospira bandrabouensis]MCW7484920.1 hypothetical protein [Leptospira bandrabouensis]